MATEPVDREALIEQVTRLATDHADLQEAVRIALLGIDGATATGDVLAHIDGVTLQELRRLTGDS